MADVERERVTALWREAAAALEPGDYFRDALLDAEAHLAALERDHAKIRAALDAARQAQTFHIYWCPICEVQTERPWHSFRDGGLIPQNDTEHQCERIEVVARAALGVEGEQEQPGHED